MMQAECLRQLLFPASSRPQVGARQALVEAGPESGGDVVYTFAELEALIDGCTRVLKKKGLSKGDRLILKAPNSARLTAAMLAGWRLSLVCIPLDFRLTGKELDNVAVRLKARALFASTKHNPDFMTEHHSLTESGIELLDLESIEALTGASESSIEETITGIDLKAPALTILTSGTTGVPKGAVHDLGTLMINLAEWGALINLTQEKRALLPLPVSHIFGLEVTLICLMHGASVVFTDLSPSGFFQAMARYTPHILVGVPTVYGAMLSLPKEKVVLTNAEVLLCGGAPLPVSLAEQFHKTFGKKLNNGYGSTESKIIALNLNSPDESIGKAVPSVTVRIVNANDEPLPEGEVGEIRIDGPILMQGYIDQEEATRKVLHLDQGVPHYHTGDIGYIKNGDIFISGRAKEMIIVAGNKVFPVEVETTLRQQKDVSEVAVIGLPHSKLGQIVKAIVVVKEGRLSDLLKGTTDEKKEARQELLSLFKEYSRETLKRELRPMDWDFRPASEPLPKTMSGKVDKKVLEAVAAR